MTSRNTRPAYTNINIRFEDGKYAVVQAAPKISYQVE